MPAADDVLYETERQTGTASAWGEPCLYMHGWWKNVSLNGSQLSAALRTAKTSRGNKTYYYNTAIINYPLSLIITVSFALTYTHLHTCTMRIFPWGSPRRVQGNRLVLVTYCSLLHYKLSDLSIVSFNLPLLYILIERNKREKKGRKNSPLRPV